MIWSAGPAIIVASVVLGPGSILTNSRVGWRYGYELIWVLATACFLMVGMTALSSRLGVFLQGSLCSELARRHSRCFSLLVGGSLFLVCGSFQLSNNLGVLFGLEPFLSGPDAVIQLPPSWPIMVLLALNALVIAALVGFRELYRPVEMLMKVLVAVMILGFAVNLILAKPNVWSVIGGLWPRIPETSGSASSFLDVFGLIATTFSVGGAFYQAYLVQQKGWGRDDVGQGLVDSAVGIGMLGLMSVMIMITSAAVLHGNPAVSKLDSAADVAIQLRPSFGAAATALFCIGIFAGALSSFLVNALIGGVVLADALNKGRDVNSWWARGLTIAALLLGMLAAIATKQFQIGTGKLIVFAQALTVLGNPLMAGALLYLAYQPDLRTNIPGWLKAIGWLGLVAVCFVSARTVMLLL